MKIKELLDEEVHNTIISNYDLINGKLAKQYPNIANDFNCSYIKLTSLEGAPKIVGNVFNCNNTNITSLEGIGKDYLLEIGGYLFLNKCNDLTSHMLGILNIKKLKAIEFDVNKQVEAIFNEHLFGDRDIIACQSQLIEAGYKDYAKL
jgi:hypothetical protein